MASVPLQRRPGADGQRGMPAGRSTLSIATLAILTGAAVVGFLVVVSFVFGGI